MRSQLIERLAARENCRVIPASLAAETKDCAADGDTATVRKAAVLVPLVDHRDGMSVLLTRRAAHLRAHPGQISFPGGRVDPGDIDATDTALRETEEEVGLQRSRVDVVGRLDTCLTGTGYSVVPVVGVIEAPFSTGELTLDSFEVAEAFEVPLRFFLDPNNHVKRMAVARGMRRTFYVLPYRDRYIWGATARILVNLSELLRHPA